ncbi:MAG: aspartate aminotransferase family protein [Acidobacteria bacterium]|nr:aspartate aminotransferase family protein [Acidobacteriota bacterium]
MQDTTQLGLDPHNWPDFRTHAHELLDHVLDFQQNQRDRPAWQAVPPEVEALAEQAVPLEGLGDVAVMREMVQHVLPYPPGHAHPRFWGWVCGTGTPIGMLADLVAAGMNASAGTFNEAPTRIENQVIRWMLELFDFPSGASGILTSGASMANVIGLAVGRDAILGHSQSQAGLAGLPKALVYASDQVHSSVDKAMNLLGLGRQNLRKIPTDSDYRISLEALKAAITQDRANGYRPLALVGNAGTVNTGAIDDLEGLAAIAQAENLWFHVDGAIGGLAVLSPNLKTRFSGMEKADSIAFDFHKWMYVPYEAGCVIVRHGDLHRQSFQTAASYLEAIPRGIAAVEDPANIRGPQLSRGFKALKVWAQMRSYGTQMLGQLMEQNVADVAYLAQKIQASVQLELLAPATLNIVCFRFVSTQLTETQLDDLNKEILMRLQESGIAVPSSTRIRGHFALRVANTNHRTRREDFDVLLAETLNLGNQLLMEQTQQPVGA